MYVYVHCDEINDLLLLLLLISLGCVIAHTYANQKYIKTNLEVKKLCPPWTLVNLIISIELRQIHEISETINKI